MAWPSIDRSVWWDDSRYHKVSRNACHSFDMGLPNATTSPCKWMHKYIWYASCRSEEYDLDLAKVENLIDMYNIHVSHLVVVFRLFDIDAVFRQCGRQIIHSQYGLVSVSACGTFASSRPTSSLSHSSVLKCVSGNVWNELLCRKSQQSFAGGSIQRQRSNVNTHTLTSSQSNPVLCK